MLTAAVLFILGGTALVIGLLRKPAADEVAKKPDQKAAKSTNESQPPPMPDWLVKGLQGPAAAQAEEKSKDAKDRQEVVARESASPPAGKSLSAEELFKKASPAVVRVDVLDGNFRPLSHGSGFLVSEDGLVVTNYHVIRGAFNARLVFGDGSTVSIEGVAASDPRVDLALLKIDGHQLPFLQLAESELPPIGSKVFAIGSPKGLTNSLSDGLVSGHPPHEETGIKMILTTAPISPGSSGGPLFAPDGKVVGVTSESRRGGQNLNRAIPAQEVTRLVRARGPVQPLANVSGQPLQQAEDAEGLKEVWQAINAEDFAKALRLLDALPASEKSSAQYWFAVGFVQSRLGNHQLAADAWEIVVRLDPKNTWGFYNLGISLGYLGRWRETIEALRTAVALKPDFTNAYFALGNAFINVGQFSDAIGALKSCIALEPNRSNAHTRLGWAYFKARSYDNAVASYETAIGLAPDYPDNHYWLGFIHFELAKTYAAAKWLTKARAQRTKALESLRQATKLDPKGKVGRDAKTLHATIARL